MTQAVRVEAQKSLSQFSLFVSSHQQQLCPPPPCGIVYSTQASALPGS